MKHFLLAGIIVAFAACPAAAQRRPQEGPPNPYWGNTQAAQEGEQVYNAHCTSCHGVNGGAGVIGPAIVNPGSAGFRGERSEAALLEKIRNGVPNTPMPAWKGKLSEDDILKMGAYIHVLRGTAIDSPLPGDVAHGEQVFFGKGECSACHSIQGKGGLIAPDLTDIAGKRKAVNIRNALTKQEHRLWMDGGEHLASLPPMDTYDPVLVTLKNGQKIDGVMLNQDSYSLQVLGLNNQLHLLDRAQVSTIAKKSPLMPTDYDKRLTDGEFKDLMAFLTRQGRKAPQSRPGPQAPVSPD